MERNALEALGRLLDGLGIRWVLIGALAANRYRITTRLTQDVADIEAILAAKPSLDEPYVGEWAEFWGVLDLWQRLRGS